MGTISYTIPTAGSTLNSIADPEIATALQTLLTWANGNVDAVNLSAALAQAASVNQSGQTVKGSSNISTSQSTSSTTYTTLATPDQVQSVVLPTNGLIQVCYQAIWSSSASAAGGASIFLNSNQLQLIGATGPVALATSTSGTGQNFLASHPTNGLVNVGITSYSGDATTGQVAGEGMLSIFAAAGTYTISVQFKASSGNVTVANRRLWVQALAFS